MRLTHAFGPADRVRRRFSARRVAYFLAVALIPACSGSGGCSGCGGLTPLPGGFINEERIENAAALRLTESGLDFLEAHLGEIAGPLAGGEGGIVSFPTGTQSGDFLFGAVDYTVCPDGPNPNANPPECIAEVNISEADLAIQPITPHNLEISGQVPLRLQNLPFTSTLGDMVIVLNDNDACPGDEQAFAPIGVTINLSIETDLDPDHARYGYSRIGIQGVSISQTDVENAIKLNCEGFLGTIANALRGVIVGQLMGGLSDTLVTTVENQLCQKANPAVSPSCPTGTNDVEGVCRYGSSADSDCVSMVLGTDGHADLGGLLAGISPGTKGGMDFLLAAGGPGVRDDGTGRTWGDLNPIANGMTLGMMGGVEPNPVSGCVPLSSLARPSGLRIPDELLADSVAGWPSSLPGADHAGPDLGIGISESFFNYALSGMYNSGLLCIGFSTETVDLLNSGTLGLLAQSLRDLGIQRETQPIAIVLKPKNPPHVTFGNGTDIATDPLIQLDLVEAGFDFYVFSSDRYIRFMTATFDIHAPMNLTVTPEGLVPVLDELQIVNGSVENSSLLKEDPAVIAASLEGLLSSQVGALLGSGLPAVDLNGPLASFGLKLIIPESVEGAGSPGLRTVVKNDERFLGIFGTLAVAEAEQQMMETSAEIVDKSISFEGLRAETLTADNGPVFVLETGVRDDGGRRVERQYRVDGGTWHPWTEQTRLRVKDATLRMEGEHEIEVRSRLVGDAYSVDPVPVVVPVIVDATPPEVVINGDVNDFGVAVFDLASKVTESRIRFDDDEFSDWMPTDELASVLIPEEVEMVEVESKDSSGNVGTARQALVRGLPRSTGGGCGGCAVPTETKGSLWGVMGAILAGAALARRRRRSSSIGSWLDRSTLHRAVAGASVVALGGSFQGCSCSETESTDPKVECEAPNCVTLEPGLIGSYTSGAIDSKGVVWVSGYNEANYESAFPNYGDLAVGKVEDEKVLWELVDGVPTDPAPDPAVTNVDGFRGGQTNAGDDVGIWTSLAIDPASDMPRVAYYDRTHKGLKFASFDGSDWAVSVVDDSPTTDSGRYAKLGFDGSTAVIAFQSIEPAESGFITSKVRLARQGGAGFTFEDVVVNTSTPCRSGMCGTNLCLEAEGECAPPSEGCGTCADGETCVSYNGGDACKVALKTVKVEPYPVATGNYIAMAPIPSGGIGLAFYDRVAGTMNVAARAAEGWEVVVVDGGVNSDVGVGASLTIDANTVWHLAYVDGYSESLKYARVKDGEVEVIETIDDGLGISGVPFPDGQHLVGDDTSIVVNGQGVVTISYQDSTNGQLRFATGEPTATGRNWTVRVLEQDAFGGFFSKQLNIGGGVKVMQWSRKLTTLDNGTKRGVGDVSFLSP